jgi:subtilisin-like proprotein convertase family protein
VERRRSHAIATLALAGAATLILGAAPSLAIVAAPAPAQPDFDARGGDRADIPAATTDAREALVKRLGAQAVVTADPVTGGLRSVGRTDGLLTGPSSADPATVALDYARTHADAFGLDGADLATLEPITRSVSPDGVTHLTFGQLDNGVGAYDSALTANVTADGRLINAGGAPVHDLQVPSTDPPLGPAAARTAARRDLGLAADGQTGTVGTDPARTTRFNGLDRAGLVTLADPDGDRLAWKLTVAGDGPYVYEVLVDAADGAILTRHSLTDFASSASVVEHHPGDGSLHTVDLAAWLTLPVTALTGPNVHAYADRSEPDGIGGVGDVDTEVSPNPGTTDFNYPAVPRNPAAGQYCPTAFTTPCTWSGTSVTSPSIAANVNQVTTQVFYYVNRFHDWLAQAPVGFTPASYNFEAGGPGGSDPVNAETDDYGSVNNANMVTPPDGQPGRMQMYLFKSPFPAVNGGDDASIVYHEYTHGLTNRLVGNDGQANGLLDRQSQAMGEGWSDWYAMDFLTAQGTIADTGTPGEQVIGAYATDNTATGIRENAIDCPVGAASASCPGTALTGPGGFTYADLGRVDAGAGQPSFEVHADGEIWAETLWDLRRTVGATAARGLISSALRLSPKQPSFLEMRDAILQADTIGGGARRAQIWSAFAARGMGYSASTTSANATHATAAFDTPPVVAVGAPDVTSAALEQDTVLHVPIVNPNTTPLTGVRATLSATTTGVTVPADSVAIGTLGAGASATATFAVRVAAGAGCGAMAGLSLAITTDQGPRTAALSLPVGTGSATAATRSYAPAVAIPDNQPAGGLSSTVNVTTHGRIGDLRLTLAATHPWIGDLHASLTSPSGTTVDLFERPGIGTSAAFSPGNLVPTIPLILGDAATGLIQEIANANVSVGGALRPNEPFARFAGEDRFGTWTLRITDASNNGGGTLSSWSLETAAPACAVTDAPTGMIADGATFHARIDPGAAATSAAFELGTTAAYGARSPASALTTGGGLQSIDVTTGGLTAGQAYHVRAIALRNGVVVATGADRTFVAGVDPPPPVDPGPPPPIAPVTPTTPVAPNPPVLQVPKATMKGITRTARLDRKGRLSLSFLATPAKARGTIKVTSGKTGGGGASFTIAAKGRTKVTFKTTNKIRSLLRKRTSLKVKATVRIGVTSLSATLTIKPYKKPER